MRCSISSGSVLFADLIYSFTDIILKFQPLIKINRPIRHNTNIEGQEVLLGINGLNEAQLRKRGLLAYMDKPVPS